MQPASIEWPPMSRSHEGDVKTSCRCVESPGSHARQGCDCGETGPAKWSNLYRATNRSSGAAPEVTVGIAERTVTCAGPQQ